MNLQFNADPTDATFRIWLRMSSSECERKWMMRTLNCHEGLFKGGDSFTIPPRPHMALGRKIKGGDGNAQVLFCYKRGHSRPAGLFVSMATDSCLAESEVKRGNTSQVAKFTSHPVISEREMVEFANTAAWWLSGVALKHWLIGIGWFLRRREGSAWLEIEHLQSESVA